MQIPSGMTPFNHDLKIDHNVASNRTDQAAQATQQSRVTSGGAATPGGNTAAASGQQGTAQQAGGSQGQGEKKEGGLQKLFAAIQKGVEQLLGLIPVLGNMLKSLLPKTGGQGGAAGLGAG